MNLDYELRTGLSRKLTVRDAHGEEDDNTFTLTGLAARTGFDYQVGGEMGYMEEFTERIQRGAFEETLAGSPDVTLLVSHAGLPLARTTSGTLQLHESHDGLEVEARLDRSDPDVARLVPKIQRGDLSKMSIGFYVREQVWNGDYDDRTITRIDLNRGDVAVVTHPANPATLVSVRSLPKPTGLVTEKIAPHLLDRHYWAGRVPLSVA